MENYCGNCVYLDINGSRQFGDEYYCDKIFKYRSVSKEACSSFIERPKGGYKRAGFSFWYVVTQICKMLDISLDSDFFETLISLKTYLLSTEEGQLFLKDYDEIGPDIALKLSGEGRLFALDIFSRFLKPCEQSIKAEEFEMAFNIYKNMINELKFCYNVDAKKNLTSQRIRTINTEECK